jgi:hypothetical protein
MRAPDKQHAQERRLNSDSTDFWEWADALRKRTKRQRTDSSKAVTRSDG